MPWSYAQEMSNRAVTLAMPAALRESDEMRAACLSVKSCAQLEFAKSLSTSGTLATPNCAASYG